MPRFGWSPGSRLRDRWSRLVSPRAWHVGVLHYWKLASVAVCYCSNMLSVDLNIFFGKTWLSSVSFLIPVYMLDYLGKHLEPSAGLKGAFAYLLQHLVHLAEPVYHTKGEFV